MVIEIRKKIFSDILAASLAAIVSLILWLNQNWRSNIQLYLILNFQ